MVGFWSGSVGQMAKLTAGWQRCHQQGGRQQGHGRRTSFPLRLEGQQKWFKKYWAAKVGRQERGHDVDVVAANLYPKADQAPERR